jgi:hypothetical protein
MSFSSGKRTYCNGSCRNIPERSRPSSLSTASISRISQKVFLPRLKDLSSARYLSEPGIATDDTLKPVIILPPFVLGANILAFLIGEKKSYPHSFANGNKVANGDLMGWVHKLKSIEDSGPMVAFVRDIMILSSFCPKTRSFVRDRGM